jgi:N-acetylmuramoyl-L-alanine amidase-like protein
MKLTRRQMMLAGLGMLLTGCAETTQRYTQRPRTPWPTDISKPTRPGAAARAVTRPRPTPTRPVAATSGPPGILPRSWWTRSGPIRSKVNPMGSVSRITVHHEGSDPVWFTDVRTTRAHLERVRSAHTGASRRWGDIGYHYIIDRAGRVIEGRAVAYQGAHVSKQNEHNVGVMLLGNFEKQSPSPAQLTSLQNTLRHLMARYRVPVGRVYTHRELGPTVCPGRNLQPRVARLRTSGALA